jgi:hypothetical protein
VEAWKPGDNDHQEASNKDFTPLLSGLMKLKVFQKAGKELRFCISEKRTFVKGNKRTTENDYPLLRPAGNQKLPEGSTGSMDYPLDESYEFQWIVAPPTRDPIMLECDSRVSS